jgi:uncharacterized membrane protein
MFAWEVTHQDGLADFLLKNDLPLDARHGLALLLLGGIAAGLALWLALGWALALSHRQRDLPSGLRLGARLVFVATPLPFLPILAIPGLMREQRLLALGAFAGLAAVAFVAVRGTRASPVRETSKVPALGSPRAPAGLIVTLILTAGYAIFMSVLTVARHNSFMTHAFDLGIHDQSIYNILHSGYMRTTLYGPYAINYIGDHFSPILFLLAPAYAVYQDARTLLVIQSFFLAAGAVPLYLLTWKKTRSALLGVVLAASYLLYPALHGANLGDFHQIALLCAPLLAALYFLETERDIPFLLALGLALIVKEEVSLTVAAIGAYVFLGKRRYRLGAALVAVGLAYFAVVTGWLMPKLGGTPQIDTRFGGYIAAGTRGTAGVAWTLFTNPIFTLVWILGNPAKLLFLAQLFLPVLALPILAPAAAWLPALPALAVLLLTSAHTQYDITYHYSAHLIPSVFFLAALGLARVRRMAAVVLAAGLLIAGLAMSYQYGQIITRQGVKIPAPSKHDAVVESFIAQIPREASVSAMSSIAPHLTARKTIYLFPEVVDAEYLLLDTDLKTDFWPHEGIKARDRSIRDMIPYVRGGQFGLVRAEDSVFLFRRGLDTSHNDEALRALLTTRYEAEEMSSDLDAPPIVDAQASGGRARMATPAALRADGKTALAFGPYTDLPPGKYRVEFRLKTDQAGQDDQLATVDVFTYKDGGAPRSARDLTGADFTAPDQYHVFALEFESDQPLEDLEFRVQYGGKGTLWLDYVQVTPIEVWLQ